MASTYSTNLRLELIGTGEQQGTWGITTNTNLGTLLEEAIGGYVSVTVTDGADTVLTVSNGAADQSRNMTLNFTGALTAARNVIAPAIEKVYLVKNSTTGGFAVTLKVSGQTGVSIPNGATALVYVDGTDVKYLTGSFASYGPIPTTSANNTFTASQIISVTDNTNAALRITQLGTGNALLVEDSANPDSTPFVIDATGNVGIGGTTPAYKLQVEAIAQDGIFVRKPSTDGSNGGPVLRVRGNRVDDNGSFCFGGMLSLEKVRDGGVITNGQVIGSIVFGGNYTSTPDIGYAASIAALGTGTWSSTSAAPTALAFFTGSTAQTSTNVPNVNYGTERMRINSDGGVGIGTSNTNLVTLAVGRNITGGSAAIGIASTGTIQSDVTVWGAGLYSAVSTAATAFTLGSIYHVMANQGTIGAGSSVNYQMGFYASTTLLGATNNYGFFADNTAAITTGKNAYGFYSAVNTATGGGTAWSFYSAGTADSYFAGSVGIGTNGPSYALDVVSADSSNGYAQRLRSNGTATKARIQFTTNNAGQQNAYIEAADTQYLAFATATTERARIDSAGVFMFGTTNSSATAGVGLKIGSTGSINAVTAASTAGTNFYHLYSTGAAAYRFYVGAEGRVYCTNTTITAISDQRLKENIRDLDDGLDVINRLKPRRFDWKAGKGANIKDARGFIAQEFEQVFPDLINEWLDAVPEGEEPYKAISPDILPVLVKAIQELSAKNDALEARIVALEAR